MSQFHDDTYSHVCGGYNVRALVLRLREVLFAFELYSSFQCLLPRGCIRRLEMPLKKRTAYDFNQDKVTFHLSYCP